MFYFWGLFSWRLSQGKIYARLARDGISRSFLWWSAVPLLSAILVASQILTTLQFQIAWTIVSFVGAFLWTGSHEFEPDPDDALNVEEAELAADVQSILTAVDATRIAANAAIMLFLALNFGAAAWFAYAVIGCLCSVYAFRLLSNVIMYKRYFG